MANAKSTDVGECVRQVVVYLLVLRGAAVTPVSFSPRSSESCLSSGFTETVPPEEELSQYSATVLQPGDRAIYTTLSFRCNGTLESLTVPSQIRESDYSPVAGRLDFCLSIWRFNGGYKFISESRHEIRRDSFSVGSMAVLSINFTVDLQTVIQAGDVLGFQLNELGGGGRLEHLPLLYKPSPIPGTFTPIIIANFTPTSDPQSSEPSVEESDSAPSDGGLRNVKTRMCL